MHMSNNTHAILHSFSLSLLVDKISQAADSKWKRKRAKLASGSDIYGPADIERWCIRSLFFEDVNFIFSPSAEPLRIDSASPLSVFA